MTTLVYPESQLSNKKWPQINLSQLELIRQQHQKKLCNYNIQINNIYVKRKKTSRPVKGWCVSVPGGAIRWGCAVRFLFVYMLSVKQQQTWNNETFQPHHIRLLKFFFCTYLKTKVLKLQRSPLLRVHARTGGVKISNVFSVAGRKTATETLKHFNIKEKTFLCSCT